MTIRTLAGWAAQQSGQGAFLENGQHGPPLNTNLSEVTLVQNFSLGNSSYDPLGGHAVWEVFLITLVSAGLSLLTVAGNVLVVLSVKVNQRLKTVNNYFLLSLACADLIIGAISMNLYTTYIVMGRWALGNLACDLWLALDYVASNASVMNLLVISFDRYFSVTHPLTYRAKRTPRRAAIMIGLAWTISFILWAPAILFWQYIVGQQNMQSGQCHIQFQSQPIITFGTAIAAFYLPVTIMIILYWRIYSEMKKRSKELASLQGNGNRSVKGPEGGQSSKGRSRPAKGPQPLPKKYWESFPFKRSRACQLRSDADEGGSSCKSLTRGSEARPPGTATSPVEGEPGTLAKPWLCCLEIRLPLVKRGRRETQTATAKDAAVCVRRGPPDIGRPGNEPECMELEESSLATPAPSDERGADSSRERRRLLQFETSSSLSHSVKDEPLADCSAPKPKRQMVQGGRSSIIKEKKAAKTLCAILLAFIITWTPYNIMVLLSTFCNDCIPRTLWQLGYWLCYVNSTVNPMCYALCNKEFRITIKMLLLCRWDKRKPAKKTCLTRRAVPP